MVRMSDTISKDRIARYLEEQLETIEKYREITDGKENIYSANMKRDEEIMNSLLAKIYAGRFDT
jgi:hypothetical protein